MEQNAPKTVQNNTCLLFCCFIWCVCGLSRKREGVCVCVQYRMCVYKATEPVCLFAHVETVRFIICLLCICVFVWAVCLNWVEPEQSSWIVCVFISLTLMGRYMTEHFTNTVLVSLLSAPPSCIFYSSACLTLSLLKYLQQPLSVFEVAEDYTIFVYYCHLYDWSFLLG